MTAPHLSARLQRHALPLLALLAALFVAAGAELAHLARSRTALQARGQANTAESRCALLAQDLLSQQDAAIRDVVLATEPLEIQRAEARFDAIDLHYERNQEVLQTLLADDAQTTPAEQALMAEIRAERRAMAGSLEQVLALARVNLDGPAARLLIEAVMPHQRRLRALLGELDVAQQDQNRLLDEEAGAEYWVALGATVLLAALGVLLAGSVAGVARRTKPSGA